MLSQIYKIWICNCCSILEILIQISDTAELMYRPFHKTLHRSNASVNWMSVRFYETDCIQVFSWIFFRTQKNQSIFLESLHSGYLKKRGPMNAINSLLNGVINRRWKVKRVYTKIEKSCYTDSTPRYTLNLGEEMVYPSPHLVNNVPEKITIFYDFPDPSTRLCIGSILVRKQFRLFPIISN